MIHKMIGTVSYDTARVIVLLGDELTKTDPEWQRFILNREIVDRFRREVREIETEMEER